MKITTNNIARECLSFEELPQEIQTEYIEFKESIFFKYKGSFYSLDEFTRTIECKGWESPFDGWHGYYSHNYFSGLVVKLVYDFDSKVIVGNFKR